MIIILVLDDVGVKNDQKVSHNMILMSKYKGQHGEKTCQNIRDNMVDNMVAMPERKHFFYQRCFLRKHLGFDAGNAKHLTFETGQCSKSELHLDQLWHVDLVSSSARVICMMPIGENLCLVYFLVASFDQC